MDQADPILIIDDEPQVRETVKAILEMEGFAVQTAENGRRGVEAAAKIHPQLIVCDLNMPELDGFGVLENVRKVPGAAAIPFIFLTGRTGRADQRQGMNLGADDYLTKPVSKDELVAAVRSRLKRHQQQRAGFQPDFSSHLPLRALGLTSREAEVLLWIAQGKSNVEAGIILGMKEKTVKRHLTNLFAKLGVDNRNAATVRAFDVLCSPGG